MISTFATPTPDPTAFVTVKKDVLRCPLDQHDSCKTTVTSHSLRYHKDFSRRSSRDSSRLEEIFVPPSSTNGMKRPLTKRRTSLTDTDDDEDDDCSDGDTTRTAGMMDSVLRSEIRSLLERADAFFERQEFPSALQIYREALDCARQDEYLSEVPSLSSASSFSSRDADDDDDHDDAGDGESATTLTEATRERDDVDSTTRRRDRSEGDRTDREHVDADAPHYVPLLYNRVGVCLLSCGDTRDALDAHRSALEYYEAVLRLPEHHPLVQLTQNSLSTAERTLSSLQSVAALHTVGHSAEIDGRYGDAHQSYTEALQMLRTCLTYPQHHPSIAITLHYIGVVHWKRGHYDKAVETLKEALHVLTRNTTQCVYHPEYADLLDSLGSVYFATGDYKKAMYCFQSSLTVRETNASSSGLVPTSEHPHFTRTLIKLGMVYDEMGKLSKAMKLFKEGLAAQRRSLGNDHIDIAATLNSLGVVHEKRQEYQDAIDAYEEALSIYTKRRDGDEDDNGGGDDPRRHLVDVAVTLNNIGEVHRKLGRYDLAMQAYQRGLSHTIAVLGPNHRNVAATLHNVASVHTGRGDHAKALDLYRRVLALQRQTLGDGHLDVATTMSSMGEVYEQRGTVAESPEERTDKYSKALKLYKKALRARRQAVGEDHVYVAFTLLQLGRFHRVRDGNRAEAVRRYSEALSVYRNNNLDERHPYVRVVVKERALIPIE